MKSIKYFLPLIVLFLSIGYAATNVTLSITGDVITMSDIEDFDVYISDIKVDGVTDISLLTDKLTFEFVTKVTDNPTQTSEISYDITNNSANFDANIITNCSERSIGLHSELTAKNSFGSEYTDETIINSKETVTGKVTFSRFGPVASTDSKLILSCTITAEPVERIELGAGDTPTVPDIQLKLNYEDTDNDGYISISDTVAIDNEVFRIINSDEEYVTMLTQNNLGTDYKQTGKNNYQKFSDVNGWEYTGDNSLINIQDYNGPVKTYINNYVTHIQKRTQINNITGDLVSHEELIEIGCSYVHSFPMCETSVHIEWLNFNNAYWWSKNAASNDDVYLVEYMFYHQTAYNEDTSSSLSVIRPIIKIPYSDFKEKFNVSYAPDPYNTFYIGGVAYIAPKGMTWEEWVESDYNTDGVFEVWQDGKSICKYQNVLEGCITLENIQLMSMNPEITHVIHEGTQYIW